MSFKKNDTADAKKTLFWLFSPTWRNNVFHEEVEEEPRLYEPGIETYRVKTFQYSLCDGANQSILGPIVFEI